MPAGYRSLYVFQPPPLRHLRCPHVVVIDRNRRNHAHRLSDARNCPSPLVCIRAASTSTPAITLGPQCWKTAREGRLINPTASQAVTGIRIPDPVHLHSRRRTSSTSLSLRVAYRLSTAQILEIGPPLGTLRRVGPGTCGRAGALREHRRSGRERTHITCPPPPRTILSSRLPESSPLRHRADDSSAKGVDILRRADLMSRSLTLH